MYKAFTDACNHPLDKTGDLFSVARANILPRKARFLDKIANYFVSECFVAGQTQYLSLSVVKWTERKTTVTTSV